MFHVLNYVQYLLEAASKNQQCSMHGIALFALSYRYCGERHQRNPGHPEAIGDGQEYFKFLSFYGFCVVLITCWYERPSRTHFVGAKVGSGFLGVGFSMSTSCAE